jgi:hypothetical protein
MAESLRGMLKPQQKLNIAPLMSLIANLVNKWHCS